MRGRVLRGGLRAAASTFGQAAVALEALPTIEVVGVSPVAGGEIDKVPSNVLSVRSQTFSHTKTPDFFRAMIQGIPFVAPNDESGNQFQIELDYRGFTASPAQEIPQGIAVYQNGARINEAYGDLVNGTSSRKWPSIA